MAWAIPLCVLPSAIWRLQVIGEEPENWWYFVLLSAGSMAVAFLAVGLVRPWGERVPARIPAIGGRELSSPIVTCIACVGAVIVMTVAAICIFNYFTADAARPDLQIVGDPGSDTRPIRERPQAGQITALYAPMLAWGPLLIVVAISYYRRRTRPALPSIPADTTGMPKNHGEQSSTPAHHDKTLTNHGGGHNDPYRTAQ